VGRSGCYALYSSALTWVKKVSQVRGQPRPAAASRPESNLDPIRCVDLLLLHLSSLSTLAEKRGPDRRHVGEPSLSLQIGLLWGKPPAEMNAGPACPIVPATNQKQDVTHYCAFSRDRSFLLRLARLPDFPPWIFS